MPFGFKQVNKTVPEKIKNIRDSLIYFFIGCLAFANLFAPRLHLSGEDYAMWIGFIMLVLKAGARLFGINDEEAEENVQKAIDEAVNHNDKK